ncbi:MAG: MgtC/SapB family protein [bacterium]|jgi:putative Mg2+ transporter-C (MgtC) family protein|nr:MgtC/SapB family protein [bacterium]
MIDSLVYMPLFWKTVAFSVLTGGLMGLERQLRGKPAGIRTSVLICLGTTVFVFLSHQLGGPGTDPTRVLGQVVTGIGFLGGGVMLIREGIVYGVTTAAVIWMLAAVGSMIGLGYFGAAFALALVQVAVLVGVEIFEARVPWFRRGVHAVYHKITIQEHEDAEQVRERLREEALRRSKDESSGRRRND